MKVILTIVLFILFLSALVIWWPFSANDESKPPVTNDYQLPNSVPSSDTQREDDGLTLLVPGSDGDIYIRDVRNIENSDLVSSGRYEIGPASPDDFFPEYNVIFSETQGSLSISLNKSPLSVTRQKAESYLISILGVSPEVLCSLKTLVSVPFDVDPALSGKDLGFSFCPGSVSLQ